MGSTNGSIWDTVFVYNGIGRLDSTSTRQTVDHLSPPGLTRLLAHGPLHLDLLIGVTLFAAIAFAIAARGAGRRRPPVRRQAAARARHRDGDLARDRGGRAELNAAHAAPLSRGAQPGDRRRVRNRRRLWHPRGRPFGAAPRLGHPRGNRWPGRRTCRHGRDPHLHGRGSDAPGGGDPRRHRRDRSAGGCPGRRRRPRHRRAPRRARHRARGGLRAARRARRAHGRVIRARPRPHGRRRRAGAHARAEGGGPLGISDSPSGPPPL